VGFPGRTFIRIGHGPHALSAACGGEFQIYRRGICLTDSEKIKDLARNSAAIVIDRPAYLCTKEALGKMHTCMVTDI